MGPSFFTSIYIKHAQISRNSYEHFWWEIFCIVLIYYVSCKLVNNLIMRVHSIFSFKFHWLKKAKGKLALEIAGLSRWFFVFFSYFWICICLIGGFPGGKESASNAGDTGDADSIPESGRSPRGVNCIPLQYSFLENPMDRGGWWAAVCPWGSQRVHRGHNWAHTHRNSARLCVLHLFTLVLLGFLIPYHLFLSLNVKGQLQQNTSKLKIPFQ